jgi:primary-amine oxidase
VTHPLDRLTADEIVRARDLLSGADLLTGSTAVVSLLLDEPAAAEVRSFRAGDVVDRRVRVVLLDVTTGGASTVRLSLTRGLVDGVTPIDPAVDGQPPLLLEELLAVDDIVKSDARWCEALHRRGVTDLDLVRVCPLSAGHFDLPADAGRRMLRAVAFVAAYEADHCWAHPVDGLVAYVDLVAQRVVELVDRAVLPIPAEPADPADPGYAGPVRTTLRPIHITQPVGPSFTVDGDVVRWQGWTLRIGFNTREGLTLHQLSIRDGGRDRPLIHRASVAEMVVPYADPGPVRFWQNYFDAGEYLLGQQVNSLRLGCDCLGEIYYFDAVLADGDGHPRRVPNAVCLHEEDQGVLWKHTDPFSGFAETRRQRRLVISSWSTIGNYDYGFFWYLYLDGTLRFEVKATGVVFTSAYTGDDQYASQLGPGLAAPYHQHLYCVRLHMEVDGAGNAVDELDVRRLPAGPDNPYGNAFTRSVTRLSTEADGARTAAPGLDRVWRVSNPNSGNRLGRPTGYVLIPEGRPVLLADPSSSIARRAAFATRHLWTTRYHPDECYPAGDLVNQHPGGAGLPRFAAQDRSIDGADIVLWHTLGSTHFPRPEDWPVMPVDSCSFTLKPNGFFDRNPTLDVPAGSGSTCHDETSIPGSR